MRRLSKARGQPVKLAFSHKTRTLLYESYKTECGYGQEDFWYKYLTGIEKHGTKSIYGFAALVILAIIF